VVGREVRGVRRHREADATSGLLDRLADRVVSCLGSVRDERSADDERKAIVDLTVELAALGTT
jgi:hypothetical protein